MNGKLERQRILKQVITENRVASQEELSAWMEKKGLAVAQSTLSRDIRELKISKVRDEGGSCYHLPGVSQTKPVPAGSAMTAESIESLEFSGPVAVLKTRPGHAPMIASIIDGHNLNEVVGTLAGDDTVLLVARQGHSRENVFNALSGLFRGLERKRVD